jgi:hypothetical protein
VAAKTTKADLRVGETLSIEEGRILVRLEEKSGQRARLSITRPEDVSVHWPGQTAGAVARNGVVTMRRT